MTYYLQGSDGHIWRWIDDNGGRAEHVDKLPENEKITGKLTEFKDRIEVLIDGGKRER